MIFDEPVAWVHENTFDRWLMIRAPEIPLNVLSASAGLVKSHRVDGETTVMRSIEEIKQLDEIINLDGADTNTKRALFADVFGISKIRRKKGC